MVWFIFAFLAAFFESMKDVFGKKGLKNIDEYVMSWSWRFFPLFFLISLLLFFEIPSLGNQFWSTLLIAGSLGSIATVLYMKAIKSSDLSLTAPMVAFTPLFLLITSPLIVGEFPGPFGMIGVLLIVLGSYMLNIKQIHKGFLGPFKALAKEKGPKMMLLVAFIWSIASNFDKIGVQNSSPIFWTIAINAFIALILLPIMLYKSQRKARQISKHYKTLIILGLASALTSVFQMTAISLAFVAYVISIKRTSAIMSVLWGYLIFKEKGIKERLIGVIIMIIGVLFIMLS